MPATPTDNNPQRSLDSALDRSPAAAPAKTIVVGIVMGSRSDWSTLEHASQVLEQFGVGHECEID